ncbi:MAG: hypothetical protein GX079_07365 [Tissierellia bacterium]|nr:hypothetical protein [Tissierellia bacterium]
MAKAKMNLRGSRQRISMLSRHYIKNQIYFSENIDASLMRKTRLHLPNLTDFELLDDSAVFITPVLIGQPMLEKEDLSPAEKVEVISSYLKIIKDFQALPLNFQVNLIRPENFYIVSGELKHRGVLIVEDIVFERPLKFHHLRQGISNVMLDFIGQDISLYNFKTYFRELPNNNEVESYADIEEGIKKIYIKDLFVEETIYTEKVDLMQKALFQRLKQVNYKFFLIVSLLLVLLVTGATSLMGGINIGKSSNIIPLFTIIDRNENILIVDQSYIPPGLHVSEKKWSIFKDNKLIKEQKTDLVNLLLPEEGSYLISLQLKDSKGNWSSVYEESYTKKYEYKSEDELNNFSFLGEKFSEEDFYSGYKSLIFTKNTKVKLNDIYLNGSILLEFLVKGSDTSDLSFSLEGYSKGVKVLDKTCKLDLIKDTWTEFIMEVNSQELDGLSLSFPDLEGELLLDELKLSSCITPGFEF